MQCASGAGHVRPVCDLLSCQQFPLSAALHHIVFERADRIDRDANQVAASCSVNESGGTMPVPVIRNAP